MSSKKNKKNKKNKNVPVDLKLKALAVCIFGYLKAKEKSDLNAGMWLGCIRTGMRDIQQSLGGY